MWFWGSINSTIEYTEIAGQKNIPDGMTVDFDSHTNHCTYQYIYSHDNTRFMCTCPNYSGHHGNTVRYCLSVNDNGDRSTTAVGSCGEHEFNFYNNTIINSADFHLKNLYNSYVANNIFVLEDGHHFAYDFDMLDERGNVYENNCYYNAMSPLVDADSLNIDPGFISTDLSDINSFILKADSPLIGAGVEIEDDITTDFFGNEIVSNNIGCYAGVGEEPESPYQFEIFEMKMLRHLLDAISTLFQELMGIFD